MTRPIYHVPFDCTGEKYRPTTYPGHSPWSLDWNGIDGHDIGDPLHPMLAGRVYFLLPSNGQIHVENGDWGWILAHCQNIRVKVGDQVRMGDHIADLGNAGIGSTGPHVHTNHLFRRKPVQVVFDGIPLAASVAVNDKYRSGPLYDCHGLVGTNPPTIEEDDVSIIVNQTDDLDLPAGTKVYAKPSLTSPVVATIFTTKPRPFGTVDKAGWRAIEVDPQGKLVWGYVESKTGTLVPKLPSIDCTVAVKSGRQALLDQIAGIPA